MTPISPTTLLARSGGIGVAWALPGLAKATAAQQGAAPTAAGELMGILLPLALIIIVLLAVAYLVRRRFGLTGRDAPLSVVQILPVGPRERIVLVQSRSGRLFAVGVSGQSVTLITNLDAADLVAPAMTEPETAPDSAPERAAEDRNTTS